jgi:protease I
MANELSGKRVAILAASGVEQVELTQPRQTADDAGATTTLVSIDTGEIQAMNGDITPADTFPVDQAVTDVSADDFDALILPGGTCNPDTLRQNPDVIAFVQAIAAAGKPIAAICHAPWTLVEADVVRGRRLTSWPTLQTDIRNAGGNWVDEASVTDQNLTTSRKPDDIPKFNEAMLHLFEESRTRGDLRARQHAGTPG